MNNQTGQAAGLAEMPDSIDLALCTVEATAEDIATAFDELRMKLMPLLVVNVVSAVEVSALKDSAASPMRDRLRLLHQSLGISLSQIRLTIDHLDI